MNVQTLSALGTNHRVLSFFVRQLNGNGTVRTFAVSCGLEVLDSVLQKDHFGLNGSVKL